MTLITFMNILVGLDQSGKIGFFFILELTLFAFPVALVIMAIFGILVEWPKAKWMIRREKSGRFIGILLSIFIAVILSNVQILLFMNGADPTLMTYALSMNFVIALIGGGCSAIFWWQFVIALERKKRSAPVIAAQFE